MGGSRSAVSQPLIQAAGTDHVIFSKKLLALILLVLGVTMIVFFGVEQGRISNTLEIGRQTQTENNAIRDSNARLAAFKENLQNQMALLQGVNGGESEAELKDLADALQTQYREMQSSLASNTQLLREKQDTLADREERLLGFQTKLRTKQVHLKQLADIIESLNKTRPVGVEVHEEIPDDQWLFDDDEIFFDDDAAFDDDFADDEWSDDAWDDDFAVEKP